MILFWLQFAGSWQVRAEFFYGSEDRRSADGEMERMVLGETEFAKGFDAASMDADLIDDAFVVSWAFGGCAADSSHCY